MGARGFRIGQALPADDEVARFVTVLAMISNDWHRSMATMPSEDANAPEDQGLRLMLFRQQAASYYEAVTFIYKASRRSPRIATFIRELDAPTYDAAMAGGRDGRSPLHGWLERHRDVTFHYPKVDTDAYARDKEKLGEALRSAALLEGTITEGQTAATVRFGFADEVAVQLLPDFAERAEELGNAWLALDEFVRTAVAEYLRRRPDGFPPFSHILPANNVAQGPTADAESPENTGV